MSDNKKCMIFCCRYSDTHTTKSHRCGQCKKYGHGDMECNIPNSITNLNKYLDDTLETSKQCKLAGCKYYQYHSTDAHHCKHCNQREHSSTTCPLLITNNKIYNVICPTCRCNNVFPKNNIKVYGVDNKCSICLDNNVEIYFPSCGHICVCSKCCNQLNIIMDEDTIKEKYNIEYIKSIFNNNFREFNYPLYKRFYSTDDNINDDIVIKRINSNSPLEGFKLNYDYEMYNNFIKGYVEI